MFVSDKVVFVELQKTGCTHIRNLLKDLLGGTFVERHNQADPSLFVPGRTFLGSVRDPWDWYVSLWAYSCDSKGDFFDNVTTTGIRLRKRGWRLRPLSLLFETLRSRPNWHAAQWRRTFRDIDDASAFRDWLYMLHDETYFADVGEGYWRYPLNRFAGLLTYRYLKLFTCKVGELDLLTSVSTPVQLAEHDIARNFIDHFIRNEHLEADLLAALHRMPLDIPPAFAARLNAAPRTNTSSKKHATAYYYDAGSERLVADRDRLIIDKFGYALPSTRAAARPHVDGAAHTAPAHAPVMRT